MTDPNRLIIAARSKLLRGRPEGRGAFFGALAMRLELQAAHGLASPMATDGRYLKYDPAAIAAMNGDHLLALVGQAVIQCSLAHHTRRGNRNPDLYRLASQLVANPELADAGFSLPSDAPNEDRFRGMAVERVYTLLENEQPPQSKKGNGRNDKSCAWGSEPQDAAGNDGGENGGEGDGESDGDENDSQFPNRMSPEEIERERREWQMASVQAATVAQKIGTMPSFAQRYVQELHRPKVDPWEVLREYCKETMKSDFQLIPPNRRYISQGYYFPSVRSEEAMGEIVIAIDTSGSIGEDTLQEFANHINAIKEDYRPRAITAIFCDSAINRVQRFEEYDAIVLKPAGGGGTDFRPPFKWVQKHLGNEPVIFIYLTDGYGPFPDSPPTYHVIWCITSDVIAPWGRSLRIDA